MAQPKDQTTGPVYNYLTRVADEAARLALSPAANDYVLQLDDQDADNDGGKVIYLYNGTAWVRGGLVPAYQKGVLIIQEATTDFLMNCGASKQWAIPATSNIIQDDGRNIYTDYIVAIPVNDALTNQTIRIVAF